MDEFLQILIGIAILFCAIYASIAASLYYVGTKPKMECAKIHSIEECNELLGSN